MLVMMTTRFKLPPLAGDDLAMTMERDMLRRWGFLGQPNQKIKKTNGSNIDNSSENAAINIKSDIDIDKQCDHSAKGAGESKIDSDIDDSKNEDEKIQKSEDVSQNTDSCDENPKLSPNLKETEGSSFDNAENEATGSKESSLKELEDVDAHVKTETNHKNDEQTAIETTNPLSQLDLETSINVESDSEKREETFCNENTEPDAQPCLQTENEIEKENEKENGMTPSSKEDEISNEENESKLDDPRQKDDVNIGDSSKDSTMPLQESTQSVEEKVGPQKKISGAVLDLYNEATRQYSEHEFCECLLSVDEALEMCDTEEGQDVVPLWLLRSKVMNSMEDHKEALRSAYKVKADERPTRLWVEGAIAMEKLGLSVTAEMWIAMAMHLCTEEIENGEDGNASAAANDIMGVLKIMQSRLRVERNFGHLVKGKPIRVMASVKYNKIIRATRKIKKGEIIFQELPEVIEQSIKSHTITACSECAKSLVQPEDLFDKDSPHKLNADTRKSLRKLWPKRNVTPCSFCSEVKYCSEACRKNSWNNHHKVICPSNSESTAAMLYDVRRSFRDVMAADGSSWQGWWNAEFSPTLLSRMTAMVLCNANRLADLRTKESYTENHWSMCEAMLEKYSPCDKIQAAESVPKMQELLNNLFKRSKFLRYDLTKPEFNKRYSQAATNVIEFHDTTHPMNNFNEHFKKDSKLFKKLKKNHGSVLEKSSVAEFHGLFPLSCCLNHSCFPNVEIESTDVGGLPGIMVKAVRDIKPEEELVVSYVDPFQDRHERRGKLWRKYKLICECLRCLHEGVGPQICTNCWKKSKEIAPSPAEDSSLNQDESLSAELQSGNEGAGNATENTLETDTQQESTDLKSSNSPEPRQPDSDESFKPDCDTINSSQDQDNSQVSTDESNKQIDSNSKPQKEKPDDKRVVTLRPRMNFAACGRCKRAWYCSTECQKESWTNGHKKICVAR